MQTEVDPKPDGQIATPDAAVASIHVQILANESEKFRLEFHVAYPLLRRTQNARSGDSTITKKSFPEVDFLGMKCYEEDGPLSWILQEGKVSVVLSGLDHHRWTGRASFGPSDPSDRAKEEDEPNEDQDISRLYQHSDAVDAIWDPHVYWLQVFNLSLRIVYREWQWLIRNIEIRIQLWVCEHDATLEGRSKNHEAQQQVSDWLVQATQLLRRLKEMFAAMMHAWKGFSAPGGQIEYLWEIPGLETQTLVNKLRETFKNLADLQMNLTSLEIQTGTMKTVLASHSGFTNSHSTAQSHYFKGEIPHSYREIADVVQTTHQFNRETFQLNREMAEISREIRNSQRETPKIYHEMLISNRNLRQLSHETLQLSQEMAEISRDIRHSHREIYELYHAMMSTNRNVHQLSRETFRLSHEMAGISRDIQQMNRESSRAAVDTDRTTQTNLQLSVITTPFILALQYFGADKDIFSFERNSKTFGIAICILFCILSILTSILYIINHSWDELHKTLRLHKRHSDRHEAVIIAP